MAVNKVETVEIIRDLVTVLVTELTGSSAWVDNSDGTFTLPICRTYWLKAQDVITVNSIDYTVTNVTRDTSVTVTAASDPTVLTFFLDAPSFYHGTIVQTNQELSQAEANVSDRSPMAYLFRDLTDDFKDENNILDRESSIRLFFLHDTNFQDYTTDLADEETLEPMRSMAYFFVEEVLKASKLIGKIEDYSIRDYLKFGVENSSGYTENIFNDNFSGVELTITLPILKKYLCACDDVKPKIQYIDSDLTLQSSNYGTLITCTPTGACSDGTVNVNKSDATLISAETVTSGGTANYNVGDSTVKSSGTVYTSTVKATDTFTIGDVSWTDSDLTAMTTEYGAAIVCTPPPVISAFIMTVDTTKAGSAADTFVLPFRTGGTYCTVYWGDATSDLIESYNQAELTHVYASSGSYQIRIEGTFEAIFFNNGGDRLKLSSIDGWGDNLLGTQTSAFRGCSNMTATYSDFPRFASVGTDCNSMFQECTLFNGVINTWDWSKIDRWDYAFRDCSSFNQSLTGVDTSAIRFWTAAFQDCTSFDQAINGLDFTASTLLSSVFRGCTSLNQNVTGWDVSSVTAMNSLFRECTSFDQDLGGLTITALTTAADILTGVTLSTTNYDALLVGWQGQAHNNTVSLGGGNSLYTKSVSAAETARTVLTGTDSWTITDGGPTA